MTRKPILTLQITYKSIFMYYIKLLKYAFIFSFLLFTFLNMFFIYNNTNSLPFLNFSSFWAMFQIILLMYLLLSLFTIPSMLYEYIRHRKVDIYKNHIIVINDKLEFKNVKFTLKAYPRNVYEILFFSNEKKIASFYLKASSYIQEPHNTPIQVYESIVKYGSIIYDEEEIEEFRKSNKKVEIQSYIFAFTIFVILSYILF